MIFLKTEIEFPELLKYGFTETAVSYIRPHGKRMVYVMKYNRHIGNYKINEHVYTEPYNRHTKHYIKDLIKDDLVEEFYLL